MHLFWAGLSAGLFYARSSAAVSGKAKTDLFVGKRRRFSLDVSF